MQFVYVCIYIYIYILQLVTQAGITIPKKFWGAFFESVFPPKDAQKNSQEWVCLPDKALVSLPPSFCLI